MEDSFRKRRHVKYCISRERREEEGESSRISPLPLSDSPILPLIFSGAINPSAGGTTQIPRAAPNPVKALAKSMIHRPVAMD